MVATKRFFLRREERHSQRDVYDVLYGANGEAFDARAFVIAMDLRDLQEGDEIEITAKVVSRVRTERVRVEGQELEVTAKVTVED
jgi:hypothetical protein